MKTKLAAASPRLYPAFSMKGSRSLAWVDMARSLQLGMRGAREGPVDAEHDGGEVLVTRRRADHDAKLARLHDALHLHVVEAKCARVYRNRDGRGLTRSEANLGEALELLHRTRHR